MQYLGWGVTFRRLGIVFPGREPFAQHIISRSGTLQEPSNTHNFKHLVHDASSRSNRATWDENMGGLKAGTNEWYSSRCYLVEMSMKVIDHYHCHSHWRKKDVLSDFTVEILSIPPPSLGNQRRFDKNYGDSAHHIEGGPPRATKRPCSISVSFTDSNPGGLRAVLSSCGSNILGNAKRNKTFGIRECPEDHRISRCSWCEQMFEKFTVGFWLGKGGKTSLLLQAKSEWPSRQAKKGSSTMENCSIEISIKNTTVEAQQHDQNHHTL